MHYKLSKNEWLAIGNKAGWLKSAKKYESLSECRRNCPDLDVDLRQECKKECEREYGDTAKKTAAGPDGELLRKLRKIYAYVANEANDISDNQWNKWKISVDAGMSSDNTEARRFAKLIKAIVDDFKSGGSIDPNTLQDIDSEEVREGDDDRYYSGTGEPMGNGPDDDSYTRYLDRG